MQTYHLIYLSLWSFLHVSNSCILQVRMRVSSTYDTPSKWSPCWSQWEGPEHWTSGTHAGPCRLKGPHSFARGLHFLVGS